MIIAITTQEIEAESERLAALRMQMLEMHPFWGYMLLQMRLIPALDLPAIAATDTVRHIWFNPAFTRNLSNAELGFVLAHEVCHQVLATVNRRCGREEVKWNMAADYAINAIVNGISVPGAAAWDRPLYQMPQGVLFNPKYRNLIAEEIYEDLCRNQLGNNTISVELILPGINGQDTKLSGAIDHHGGIDIHLPLELDADQQEAIRDRVMAAIENYQANDTRGDLPESLLRQVGLLDKPKIPWRRLLHCYADAALNTDDYSLVRPNKHYWINDLVVPGKYSETVSSIVVALDTSGSMSEAELMEVAKEIRGLLPNAQDITLIVADCKIHQVISFDKLEEFLKTAKFEGGGGTSHICVFEYIAEHKLNPRLFIGLSDLYSCFPRKKPSYPVLWVVPEQHKTPPWGKVIEL